MAAFSLRCAHEERLFSQQMDEDTNYISRAY
jgi:hypothetical protein